MKSKPHCILAAELHEIRNKNTSAVIHTATARFREVMLSSSVPTDMEGSKMAPLGSRKETVSFSWNVTLSFARYLVLKEGNDKMLQETN